MNLRRHVTIFSTKGFKERNYLVFMEDARQTVVLTYTMKQVVNLHLDATSFSIVFLYSWVVLLKRTTLMMILMMHEEHANNCDALFVLYAEKERERERERGPWTLSVISCQNNKGMSLEVTVVTAWETPKWSSIDFLHHYPSLLFRTINFIHAVYFCVTVSACIVWWLLFKVIIMTSCSLCFLSSVCLVMLVWFCFLH